MQRLVHNCRSVDQGKQHASSEQAVAEQGGRRLMLLDAGTVYTLLDIN